MKHLLLFIVLGSSQIANGAASPELCKAVSYWLYFEALQPPYNERDICTSLGGNRCSEAFSPYEGLCLGAQASHCDGISNLGGAFCAIANGTNCAFVSTIGEGICSAAHGSACSGVSNLYEGICRALGNNYSCINADVSQMAALMKACKIL